MLGARVGRQSRVEARHVEAAAVVFDRGHEPAAGEAQGDLDVVGRAAVADGVRAGLLDTEDDVVDHLTFGAVLAQVVAQALAGAQQVRGLGRDAEVQARWRRLRLHAALRQPTHRMTTTEGGDAVDSKAAMLAVSTVAAFGATEMRRRRTRAHQFGSGARREVSVRSISRPPRRQRRAAGQRLPGKEQTEMQKISHCLWFDGRAEEAAEFYVSLFKDSRIVHTARYPEGSPGAAGSVMTVEFVLNGERFMALNGGPQYTFTPAISFVANCDTQEEIDELWEKLSQGGEEVQCGWVTDRFGVSWQVVPTALGEMMSSTDKVAAQRAFSAMLAMTKLDIAVLRRAYEGAGS